MTCARYQVRLLREPPFRITVGGAIWLLEYEWHGKNGKNATFDARCSDGRRIVILDGRERAVAHSLGAIDTTPGTVLHEVWLGLAAQGAVQLVEYVRSPPRPCSPFIDCGGGVLVPLGRKRGAQLTAAQVAKLCADAKARR